MEYDIIIGVSTKNCETTISKIVKKVDKSLTKYFSKYNSLILCCDGYSKDNTRDKFNKTKTNVDKKIISEKGKRSKGSALKTIIEKSKPYNFKVILMIDGDLENIEELWIKRLISQVIEKKYDIALGNYTLDKYDNPISTTLITPLVKSLFNTNISNLMGGEYCISRKLCLKFIGNKYFPNHSGLDLFITLTSICEGYKIAEIKLGARNHTSSQLYKNPETILIPRFNQIIKVLIQLILYYKSNIKRHTKNFVDKKGCFDKQKPRKISIDIKSYNEFSRNYISDEIEYVQEIYNNINKQSITGIKIAWLNWLSIYFKKIKNMSDDEVNIYKEKIIKQFREQKKLLKL